MTADLIAEARDLDEKLASQIGDDLSVIFSHEYLFKEARRVTAALLARLEAAEAKLALTYDDLYADALADARSDAQDFESDLWREVRKYLTELNLDWRDYADDGILAEDAIQYVRDCMDEETRRAEAAEAKAARMEEALIWCSGSEDFQDGGYAREGWLKICAPLVWREEDGK